MATSAFNHGPVRSDWAESREISHVSWGTLCPRQMLASPGAPPLEAALLQKVTPFTRSFKFAHHPGFDIAQVTGPIPRKRSAGTIESLAALCVDCREPKKFQARLLYSIYWPDSLASQFARFADKHRELPENVPPEFRL